MGNAGGISKKDWAKYEELLQKGKSESVVKKAFDRQFGKKLKGKADEVWAGYMTEYHAKYPQKKKTQRKRDPVATIDKKKGMGERKSVSQSDSEENRWEKQFRSVVAQINGPKLQYRRDIVKKHRKELEKLGPQEKWTVQYKLKGEREKRFRQGSPRANTECHWAVEMHIMDDTPEVLPEPYHSDLTEENLRSIDANTPNVFDDDLERLSELRNINSSNKRSPHFNASASQPQYVTRESLASVHSVRSMGYPMSHPSSYDSFSDTASRVSGVSSVRSGHTGHYSGAIPVQTVDQFGRPSGVIKPMLVSNMSSGSLGPYVQQPGVPVMQQPGYVMQQQPGYVMQQQPGYVMQQQPTGYAMQQGYGMQGNIHTGGFGGPPVRRNSFESNASGASNFSNTSSASSSKRKRPRTRRRRSKDKNKKPS